MMLKLHQRQTLIPSNAFSRFATVPFLGKTLAYVTVAQVH